MKKIIFVLLLIVMVGLSFSFATDTKYELQKTWNSSITPQVNPRHALDSKAYEFVDNSLFIEEAQQGDVLYNELSLLDKDGLLVSEEEYGYNHYSTIYRVADDVIFAIEKECGFISNPYCRIDITTFGKKLEKLANRVKLKNEVDTWDQVYEAFTNYGNYGTNIKTVAKDAEGNYILYSKGQKQLKITSDYLYVELITLTDEELATYFPEIVKIKAKNTAANKIYESYVELNDGSTMYTGNHLENGTSNAYLEVVKDGNVVWEKEETKYESFSNPIVVKDFVVVKATYDEDKMLGTKKADLLMYTMDGEDVSTLSTNSYFNTLISYGDYFITDRVYVEGNCSAGETVGTYSFWDTTSCATHHYYEIYEPKVLSVISENPNTRALSILLLVVVAIGVFFYARNSIKKMNEI